MQDELDMGTVYQDDDALGECFRKYPPAEPTVTAIIVISRKAEADTLCSTQAY